MIKVALTHDVDRVEKTYQYITRACRSLQKLKFYDVMREFKSLPRWKSVYWNFEDIMATEANLGVRSTFFFLTESIPFKLTKPSNWKLSLGRYKAFDEKVAKIIIDLDTNNWEIGVHGSYLSFNRTDLLVKEKRYLEGIVGHDIFGIRQHYLNWNDDTWEVQSTAGFKYDTTLGYTDRIGYYEDIASPFKHHGYELVEFPVAVMDICYVKADDRMALLREIIKQTQLSQGILVLNWHTDNWNVQEYPGYKSAYVEIIKLLVGLGATFKTLGEYYLEKQDLGYQHRTVKKQANGHLFQQD